MTNLRVLMIAPTSFFADYGGHIRILEEALALQKLGHRVTICTYHRGENIEGLDIERTVPIPWRKEYEVGSSRHKIAFDVLLSIKSLQAALRFRPHIIHAHLHEGALIGYPLSRLLHVPLIFDLQGSLTGEMVDHRFLDPNGFFYPRVRRLERIIDRFPKTIITSSQHAKDMLCNDFGCDDRGIKIIADSVNGRFFQPNHDEKLRDRLKSQLGIPPHHSVVVYLGLLAEWQGIGLLLDGIARLREHLENTRFLIMGFPAVDHYSLRAKQLGIEDRVVLPGRIPYFEAPKYLALGDVAVSPKISATEGCGKLLNYMSMALPTVAFDTPVSREYLGEWGAYAAKGDPVALVKQVLSLLEDKDRADQLGRGLRHRALTEFSWEKASRNLEAIYWAALRPEQHEEAA
jgi:glycosyltransferase involved in cell wall biosynthesis